MIGVVLVAYNIPSWSFSVLRISDDWFLSSAGVAAARPSLVVRAEEAAAPAKKPEIGPKRGSQVRFSSIHEQVFGTSCWYHRRCRFSYGIKLSACWLYTDDVDHRRFVSIHSVTAINHDTHIRSHPPPLLFLTPPPLNSQNNTGPHPPPRILLVP